MMYAVRIHGRGGQGSRTAAKILAYAAFYEDRNVQAFSIYGAERRGAPVAAFVRLASGHGEEILERGYIHNPDCVVVMDESLLSLPEVGVLEGLKPGGMVVINTSKPKSSFSVPKAKLHTIDATTIAFETLKKPITSTAMLGALAKVTRVAAIENLYKAVEHELGKRKKHLVNANLAAVKRCYDEVVL